MGEITINKKVYNGNNIIINNEKIIIDDVEKTPNSKEITIEVIGNIQSLDVDNCEKINIEGDCNKVSSVNGDIDCGDVGGSVSTVNGDVNAKNINGSVSTVNGDISEKH